MVVLGEKEGRLLRALQTTGEVQQLGLPFLSIPFFSEVCLRDLFGAELCVEQPEQDGSVTHRRHKSHRGADFHGSPHSVRRQACCETHSEALECLWTGSVSWI